MKDRGIFLMRDANRVSDDGESHAQGNEDEGRISGSRTVSNESTGGRSKVGTSSGNKSGGSGKKGDEEEE